MCMLTYSPPGSSPDFDKLREAGINNPDGFGFAIIDYDGCRIVSHRTLDLEESLAAYRKALALYDGPSLWHARWATHGDLTVDNVHPFLVDEGATVLAHNGIMPIKERDAMSDTATFAADYWPAWSQGAIDDGTQYGQLAQIIGGGSKLVILTVDPRYLCSAYIVNEEDGHWSDGSWYSNYSYAAKTWTAWSSAKWEKDVTGKWVRGDVEDIYEDVWEEVLCEVCNDDFLIDIDDDDDHFCPTCETCVFCQRYRSACDCWEGWRESVTPADDDDLDPPHYSQWIKSTGYEGRTFAEMMRGDS